MHTTHFTRHYTLHITHYTLYTTHYTLLARCEASEELGELATQMWEVVVEQEREEEEQETPTDAKKPRL